MKFNLILVSLFLSVSTFAATTEQNVNLPPNNMVQPPTNSSANQAANPSAYPSGNPSANPSANEANQAANYHPCKNIMSLCKSAGFYKGGAAEGKGLWVNCVHPLIHGKTVSGVNPDPNDVVACQTKIQNKIKNKQNTTTNPSAG